MIGYGSCRIFLFFKERTRIDKNAGNTVIETGGLCKTYRLFEKEPGLKGSVKSLFDRKYVLKHAVVDFDLNITAGEFVGLIGPNGAGKTTLVKMLTGIIAPTSGRISVLGYYPNKLMNAFKKQYAVVMGQKSQLFFELTPSDTFRLFKELYAIPDGEYKKNLSMFTELFGVESLLNVQVRTLSLGERMKMELIAALLHNPGVLFLDEPTIGLDAVAQRQIRGFLSEVNKSKATTIILTSHYMEDVRSLCPRSVVINGGLKVYDGGTAELFESYMTHKKITVTLGSEGDVALPESAAILEKCPNKVVFMAEKEESSVILSRIFQSHAVADVTVEEEDIGRVVERIYANAGMRNGGSGE